MINIITTIFKTSSLSLTITHRQSHTHTSYHTSHTHTHPIEGLKIREYRRSLSSHTHTTKVFTFIISLNSHTHTNSISYTHTHTTHTQNTDASNRSAGFKVLASKIAVPCLFLSPLWGTLWSPKFVPSSLNASIGPIYFSSRTLNAFLLLASSFALLAGFCYVNMRNTMIAYVKKS